MIGSLRIRLLVGTSLATIAVLALLAVSIFLSTRKTLYSEFDEALLNEAKTVASMTEQKHGRVKFEFDAQAMPEFAAGAKAEYFEIWVDGQKVLARSDSLGQHDLSPTAVHESSVFVDAALPDDRHGRWVTMPFTPLDEDDDRSMNPPHKAVVTVARDTAAMDRTLSQMRWSLAGVCTMATLISGAVLIFVVEAALRPLKKLAREIESLAPANLTHRFDVRDVPTELSPMIERLNGLLSRLESAFARERSFTSDVAHELRTPLAGLLTTLEVCRSRPRDAGEYQLAIDKSIQITGRLEETVRRLLLLARADARQLPVHLSAVNLDCVLHDSWAQFEQRAENRKLSMRWNIGAAAVVQSDPSLLRIVIDNLMDNAVSYADSGGTLDVGIAGNDARYEITLSNTGSEIARDDMPKLFDRFWRGDQARSDNGIHSGLGLSLCQRLVQILRHELIIETERGGRFTARLQLAGTMEPIA